MFVHAKHRVLTVHDEFLIFGDMSVIRGVALEGYLDLVRELGSDPSPLLARAHLPAESLGDHESFLGYRSVITALELAASVTGHPDFGRQLALRQGLEILGPIGVAARTAATVGEALASISHYFSIYSPALSVSISVPGGRYARFEWAVVVNHPPPHPQAAELGVGVALQVFRLLAGAEVTPAEVSFRHQAVAQVKNYRDYFGCPVRFGQPTTGFLFKPRILEQRLAADSGVHDVVRDYLNSIVVPADRATLAGPVRSLIQRMLSTGGLSIELVAEHLAMHPRTLQRQLAGEGTTFATLVEEVRTEEMLRYLHDTAMPLSHIAGLLGYSEQSVLTRSCQRWFGMSPSALRRREQTQTPLG